MYKFKDCIRFLYFQYFCHFVWSGDLTVTITEFSLLGSLVLDDDIINIMMNVYSDIDLIELINNNDTFIGAFLEINNIEYGKNKILEKFTEIETKTLTEQFDNDNNNNNTIK